MTHPLPPSLIARLSAERFGEEIRGRKGEKKSESHGGASASPPTRRHGPEKENRYATRNRETALECRPIVERDERII